MKKFILLLVISVISIVITSAQNYTSDSQLAQNYFKAKQYDKASVLYEKLYKKTSSKFYFKYLLESLIELNEFSNAEKMIKKKLRGRNIDITYYVDLGYLYKKQNKPEKATSQFEKALKKFPNDQYKIRRLANAFISKKEYDYAEKVYLKAQENTSYTFLFDLANLYTLQRKYQQMIDIYLDLLNKNEKNLKTVQNRLRYWINNDFDDSFKSILRKSLLRRIQKLLKNDIFEKMLIWLYIQEKDFKNAFRQAKAIDKRNNELGHRVVAIGNLARSNNDLDVSYKAYKYVADKGRGSMYYYESKSGMLSVLYKKVNLRQIRTEQEISNLEKQYLTTINELGRSTQTINLIRDLAHLQAFYLNKASDAISLLNSALSIGNLPSNLKGIVKIELGDILLLTGDIYEATFAYAQAEKANKSNSIGYEARFKKAKLAYFDGKFKWSLAQLIVLKSNTSKLIANDAFQLSMFIKKNIEQDSNTTAMKIFARADLYSNQNNDSLALITYDTIINEFSGQEITANVYFNKAKIKLKNGDFNTAVKYFKEVVSKYSYDLLADDAMYSLAQIYDYNLKDKNKAKQAYKNIILNYKGSIFTVEAQKRFRILRGDNIEQ